MSLLSSLKMLLPVNKKWRKRKILSFPSYSLCSIIFHFQLFYDRRKWFWFDLFFIYFFRYTFFHSFRLIFFIFNSNVNRKKYSNSVNLFLILFDFTGIGSLIWILNSFFFVVVAIKERLFYIYRLYYYTIDKRNTIFINR